MGLPEEGVLTPYAEPDGSLFAKIPWYRGIRGKLRLTAARLDASAPSPRIHIPGGYGSYGFQSTGISFPSAGCWRITGSVDRARLTFVTLVLTPPA
ncbi:MAG: hypothetical protein MSC30_15850 [Gaiellaceae bacterium MAG52_C11]|nr:hypothetical protein [Candidatus Gaiellasilicea maunaloa]